MFQSISCHYAACECEYRPEEGIGTRDVYMDEISEIAARKTGTTLAELKKQGIPITVSVFYNYNFNNKVIL